MAHVFRSTNFEGVLKEASDCFASIKSSKKEETTRFNGAGVYALYFYGESDLYIQCKNVDPAEEYPIYIGKAVPPGSRKGVDANSSDSCNALWKRINEHYRSLEKANNLNPSDFRFKAMIMHHPETDLISAVESHLIRIYCPIWNAVVDGFGNHTPGNGRFDQAKSDWDVIHPGRPFADRCRGEHNHESLIVQNIRNWSKQQLCNR